MASTEIAYQLLLNGSLFGAVNSFYTIVFNTWFYVIFLWVIMVVLLIKTQDTTLLLTIGLLASAVLIPVGLIPAGHPAMYAMFGVLTVLLAIEIYKWITK
jgi:hypothetical protein